MVLLTLIVITPLTIAIRVYVSTLIPKLLKTSTTNVVHILFFTIIDGGINILYTFCKTNTLLEKLMNTI